MRGKPAEALMAPWHPRKDLYALGVIETGSLISGYSEVYSKLAVFSAIVAIRAMMLRPPRASAKGGQS